MENAKNENMSTTTILRNARIINEGRDTIADVLIKNGRIELISPQISYEGKVVYI